MNLSRLPLTVLLSFWSQLAVSAPAEGEDLSPTNPAIARAMSSVGQAAGAAAADSRRPLYHFHPPANWMNDPNGPIYHQGYYHLFYQHNPYGEQWGHMHWGHARSRDLVRWEHLPIALAPSADKGEEHCFSGCATIDGLGRPLMVYTSIAQGRSASDHAEQWGALGDENLMQWTKHPDNPLLDESIHGGLKVYDWRDPFIFKDEGATYLVLGGNLNQAQGGQAVVTLYRAENPGLTAWKYLGVLFRHPDRAVKNIECPNFFKLGDQWVLIISPHGLVEYFVGTFTPAGPHFEAQTRGILDGSDNFYAPNSCADGQGRRLLWGWVRGFKGQGWNGCLTVPRILTLGPGGALRQSAAPELNQLRQAPLPLLLDVVRERGGESPDRTNLFIALPSQTIEISARISGAPPHEFSMEFESGAANGTAFRVDVKAGRIEAGEAKASFNLLPGEKEIDLHLFLDRSLLEIFVNDRVCLTSVMKPGPVPARLHCSSPPNGAVLKRLQVWPLNVL